MSQTMKKALYLTSTGKSRDMARAARVLNGCPVGGWGETDQAWRQLSDLLPARRNRSYTIDAYVEAVYTVIADRYRTREEYAG